MVEEREREEDLPESALCGFLLAPWMHILNL